MHLFLWQIQEKAGDIAAPLLAAQQQKEAAKEAVRKKYVPIGPARQSKRTGAQRTRAKLQQQAQDTAEGSDSEHSGSSLGEEDENDDQPEAKSNLGKLSQKRKRHAPEIDFDPAGQTEPPTHQPLLHTVTMLLPH